MLLNGNTMRPCKLFIGSGNLGNAEPDTSSIAAWIPDDGSCPEVLDHQKYPIVRNVEDFETAEVHDRGISSSSSVDDERLQADAGKIYRDGQGTGLKLEEQFDIIVLGMQESTFEPMHMSDELLDEIKARLEMEEEHTTRENIEEDDAPVTEALVDRIEKAVALDPKETEEKESTRSFESMGDESVDTIGNESADTAGNDSSDPGKNRNLRASTVLTGSMQQAALQAGTFAGKAAKTAGRSAAKVAKTAGKTTGKAARTAGKTAGKAAVTAGKTAGKAALTASKAAKTSAGHVAKVGEKAAVSAEKAARKGVSTVTTLTASREHKKDNGQLISDGTAVLHQLILDRLPSYKRLLSFQRGEMRLLVYSLEKYHNVTIKSVRAQNTGLAGLANKGGIVAECVVGEGTVMSFMSCHLEAHEGIAKYATRCSTVGDILKGTKKYAIPSIYPDASLASHFCFVLGDLNFRTRHNGRIKSEEQLEDVTALVKAKNWKELNEADELRMALEKQECLHGFQTLLCNFMPTFKLEREEGYTYKAQRTPSYTDRILWRTGDKLEKKIKALAYEPIDNYATSDHKPIRGAFDIELNRRVFLKKREPHVLRSSVFPWRSEDTSQYEDLHLFVCDIQCDLFPNSEWSSKPDSYVCLISSPEDILLKKPTKMKQITSVMKKFLKLQDVKEDSGEEKVKNTHNDGWPRTGKIKNSHNPDWKNREIQCILKTHAEDGTPINLTGAILHIFVFKHNGSQVDSVIGSYPLNLENIYRSCTLLGSHSMRRSWRKSAKRCKQEAHDSMVSLEINGPLIKNGRQTGVLRCTVDAWWIMDAHAANANAVAEAEGPGITDDPSKNSDNSMDVDYSEVSHGQRHGKVSWIRTRKKSYKNK